MRFAGAPQITDFLNRKENYQDLTAQGVKERALQDMAVMEAEGLVAEAGIKGDAMIEAAKYGASATAAKGAAQGQAAMFSGLGDAFGSIGGKFASRFAPKPPTSGS